MNFIVEMPAKSVMDAMSNDEYIRFIEYLQTHHDNYHREKFRRAMERASERICYNICRFKHLGGPLKGHRCDKEGVVSWNGKKYCDLHVATLKNRAYRQKKKDKAKLAETPIPQVMDLVNSLAKIRAEGN